MIVTDYNLLSTTEIPESTRTDGKKSGPFFTAEQLINVEWIMELEESPFANHHGNK